MPSPRCSPPISVRCSARAASSSIGSGTSAARPRSCLTPLVPAKARRSRRRSCGTSSTATTAAIISASAMRTNFYAARSPRRLQAGARPSKHCRMRNFSKSAYLPLILLLTAASPPGLARWRAEASHVTITRDDWGIAHVHGKTDADAVFGMIYAQAEDDFPRTEANYLTNLGRTAEAEGEKAIWQDLRARLYVSDNELKADYPRSPPQMRKLMGAWADGLNYFLTTHPDVHPRVLTRFEPWMALSFTEGSIGGDIE